MKFSAQILPMVSVGIDIGTDTIKLIVLRQNVNRYSIENVIITPLPPQDKSISRHKQLAAVLDKIVSDNKINATKTIISLSGENIFYQHDYFPAMKDEDLVEAIRWKYKDQVPFSVENAFIDYSLLREAYEDDVKYFECIVVLAAHENITRILEAVLSVGLSPARVSCAPFGCEAFCKEFLSFGRRVKPSNQLISGHASETVVWLEMGAKTTQLSVIKAGCLDFARLINFGAGQLEETIENIPEDIFVTFQPNLSSETNTAVKSKVKAKSATGKERLFTYDFSKSTNTAIKNALDSLTQEIIRSLSYYRDKVGLDKVSKIVISGGVADLKGIDAVLTTALNLPVEKVDLIRYLKCSDPVQEVVKSSNSRLIALVGQMLIKDQFRPNLLPAALKEKLELIQLRAPSTITLAALSLFLIAVWLLVSNQLTNAQLKLETKSQELQRLMPIYKQIAMSSSQQLIDNQKTFFIQYVLKNDLEIIQFFSEISQAIPMQLTLESITPSEADKSAQLNVSRQFTLKGFVKSSSTSTTELANFILELKKSPIVSDVTLVYLGKSTNTVDADQNFELLCSLVQDKS